MEDRLQLCEQDLEKTSYFVTL